MPSPKLLFAAAAVILLLFFSLARNQADDTPAEQKLPDYGSFEPVQKDLPVPPPAGAIVLFDGQTNRFVSRDGKEIDWPIEDGALVSSPGKTRTNHIVSTEHFHDADIHAEFMLPEKGVGNSGLYIHGHYELQIYNSFGKDQPGDQDAGALYGFAKPLVNAAKKPGEWQVYDIRYLAPRRDAEGKIVVEGSITAWLNGEKVLDQTRFGEPRSVYHPFRHGATGYLKAIAERLKEKSIGPLFLQDHDNPVKFRNVWLKPLDESHYEYRPEKG